MKAACTLAALAACDTEAAPGLRCEPALFGEPRALIAHDNWRLATAEEDPWAAFRPADIACPSGSRNPEDFAGTYSYGIATAECPYTTMVQETLADACKGESFYVWHWNFALTAPANSTSHIGVQLGATRWGVTRAIPSDAALAAEAIILDEDVAKGSPIFFHVRNHGANTYQLLDLLIVAAGDAPTP